jgi:hypothetical protein
MTIFQNFVSISQNLAAASFRLRRNAPTDLKAGVGAADECHRVSGTLSANTALGIKNRTVFAQDLFGKISCAMRDNIWHISVKSK